MSRIRRAATGLALAGLMLAVPACTSSTTPDAPAADAVQAIDPKAPHDPTTITVWSFNRLPNEIAAFRAAFDRLHQQYPWLTVQFVENKDDAAFTKEVAAGTPPDVFISGAPDNLAKFCSDGTVADLGPYLTSAGLDVDATFPASTLVYTQYQDKQCALPVLADVYALYYSKAAFAEAGITQPPRTLSELAAVAKQLTTRNPDGSIARFGFVSRSDYGSNGYLYTGVTGGTQFYGPDGKSTLGTDPRWAQLLEWDADLNAFYGPGEVDRFVAENQSHTDDASNPLLTGKVAMELDGEWHIGENAELAPNFDYGVAPMPVNDAAADTYGAGAVLGTVGYLPAGGTHQAEAAFALQQLATDTTFLHQLADTVYNVPTTKDSLATWPSAQEEHWASIVDVFANPGSYYRSFTPAGSEDFDQFQVFLTAFEQGNVADLGSGLAAAAQQIDQVNARAGS